MSGQFPQLLLDISHSLFVAIPTSLTGQCPRLGLSGSHGSPPVAFSRIAGVGGDRSGVTRRATRLHTRRDSPDRRAVAGDESPRGPARPTGRGVGGESGATERRSCSSRKLRGVFDQRVHPVVLGWRLPPTHPPGTTAAIGAPPLSSAVSTGRKLSASPRWCRVTTSLSSRSAMVRATRRTR